METTLKLSGRTPSKKNSRVNTRSGRSFPSKKYREWHSEAQWELQAQNPLKGIKEAEVKLHFRMPDDRKADLTNKAESVMDLLVDLYILEDDSWQVVKRLTLTAEIDRENPGVDIVICA